MSVFSFVPSARRPGLRHFSTVSCPFQADVRSDLPLWHPILSISTCHCCSSSALPAFAACSLTAMPLASTHLTPFCSISKVLHTTHTCFYTNQLLHQPAFTQTLFYTKHSLQKPTFTPTSFYNPASTRTTFSANQPFAPSSFTQPLLWAWKPKAKGPAECQRLLNICK